MSYAVKEMFLTLQGEGAQAGRPAVFCRFAGCNLWSGLERDRATAQCTFCDTDFVGTDGQNGGKFDTADALAEAIAALWPEQPAGADAYIVFTGGEPCLQLDDALLAAVAALVLRRRSKPMALCLCRKRWTGSASAPSRTRNCNRRAAMS